MLSYYKIYAMTIHELIAGILKIPAERVSGASMKTVAEWDSLKHMVLIVAIEQEYGIELTGDEIAEMTSVANIESIVKARGL